MTSISNISPNLLLAYTKVQKVEKLSIEDMFRYLSFAMGGDGKSITKDQLNEYIESVSDNKGSNKMSDSAMSALKYMQENFDDISGGKDVITAADMEDYPNILAAAFAGSFVSEEVPDAKNSYKTDKAQAIEDINSYLKEAALNFSTNEENSETAGLTSMLKKVLGGTTDENDDSNANLIDALTNLIAASSAPNSTTSVDA